MNILTLEQFEQIVPECRYHHEWFDVLDVLLPQYDIATPQRVAGFIAQCAHESASFNVIKENLNYSWQSLRRVFPKYFPTDAIAKRYARNPEAIANRVYANRMGNGDEASGDGWRYCGRGLIQLTGLNNYTWFGASVGITPQEAGEFMETFEGAAQSACWYWESNHLNDLADRGDLLGMTRRINGGTNGLEDRKHFYAQALEVLAA